MLFYKHSGQGLRPRRLREEGGYMLLILMFFVAMLAFAMMATLPRVVQQAKRDREEEMIHRGTEYARAIKKYYKKFNHYPNSIQDLENTNNLRFLRRRYKDPMTKDGNWRLLHITDVQQGISNPNFGVSQAGNFNPTQGSPMGNAGSFGPQINIGGTPGTNGSSTGPDLSGQGNGIIVQQQQGGTTGDTSNPSNNQSVNSTPNGPGGNPALGGQTGQTYGAGGIVGVASMSKAKSIREFGNKSNYNKWMFIYDPTQDRGTLLKGPYNPQAFQGSSTNGTGTNGAPGVSGPGGVTGPGISGRPGNGAGPSTGGDTMPPEQNAPPQ